MSDASEINTPTPGHVMAQLLESRGWSQQEFAGRMGYSLKYVRDLMNGRAAITAETAMRLESVLGESAQWWLGQEMTFRQQGLSVDETAKRVDLTSHAADWPNLRAPGTDVRGVQRIYDLAANPNAPLRSVGSVDYPSK